MMVRVTTSLRLLVVGCLILVLGSCDDNLSKSRIETLLKTALQNHNDVELCMTRIKIKPAKFGGGTPLEKITENDFPVIFSEEAFVKWNSSDDLITTLLLGDGLAVIHQGGYEQSATEKGHPGDVYPVSTYQQAGAVFEDICKRGALVELTPKGLQAHAWSNDDFCTTGRWVLDSVKEWTVPAVDGTGRTVSHITAAIEYRPARVGGAVVRNPFETFLSNTLNVVATKYADGWKINDFSLE